MTPDSLDEGPRPSYGWIVLLLVGCGIWLLIGWGVWWWWFQ